MTLLCKSGLSSGKVASEDAPQRGSQRRNVNSGQIGNLNSESFEWTSTSHWFYARRSINLGSESIPCPSIIGIRPITRLCFEHDL
ncbi:uncharacterized protein PHALS_00765 [Plasmopara halstedii]|uniref:Uncharacterized protein n=1 Tax=Plasmopara halstedii TaxID=4781 RepID=A0A0P1ATW1_PLAHL|nr:uncharacterized protein PHALS_00765 [Plasmopara halstedii]CEG44397.1 hypothetical protein PHALS_00765 [Plasmopara halstedii]|eukprot:XP_024580766.1 hypothetical protein PHALS_00765 [Plasmopara halstedii]